MRFTTLPNLAQANREVFSGGLMRSFSLCAVLLFASVLAVSAQQSAPASGQGFTLTIYADGVDDKGGNVGVLVFNSAKGWAEDRAAALKDISVPAQQGTTKVTVPDLPAGEYAVALVHDVNKNHKLDKNFVGVPKEQFGLSNNPHVGLKAPPYSSCTFKLSGNMDIHIKMQ
jgi:uncharacterized protein (DUF2141 family)